VTGKDAVLAPAGHIAGKVSNGSGTGLFDLEVSVLVQVDGEWRDFSGAYTDDGGNYDVGGLPTGTYRLQFLGDSAYLGEFYDNVSTVSEAANIAVTAGSTVSGKDATLADAGRVTGKVTNVGGTGLSNVDVEAYTLVDGTWERFYGTSTADDGTYDLGGLPTGTYRLRFRDWDGVYAGEYYNDAATVNSATDVPVTAGSATSGKNAVLALAGRITGKVTNPVGAGVRYVSVAVFDASGEGEAHEWVQVSTDQLGNFNASGLPTGSYRVKFMPEDTYLNEYYNDAQTYADGTNVAVTAGSATPSINAQLAYRPARLFGYVTAGGKAVEGVTVVVGTTGKTATSDLDGWYEIVGVPVGTHTVTYSKSGYNSQTVSKAFADGADVGADVSLTVYVAPVIPPPAAVGLTTPKVSGKATAKKGTTVAGVVSPAHATRVTIEVQVLKKKKYVKYKKYGVNAGANGAWKYKAKLKKGTYRIRVLTAADSSYLASTSGWRKVVVK
jgi:hypothetical protein